jgi:hypothetical protein
MIYLLTKFHMPRSIDLQVIAIKLQAKGNIFITIFLLIYIVENILPLHMLTIFPMCIVILHLNKQRN